MHTQKKSKPTLSTPSLTREDLKALILKSLQQPYFSQSCKDKIRTDNHYQSVHLDGIPTPGVRTSRKEFLDQIDFRNRRVLDLGSNLGEISRAARERGASAVDGFEYDPYFIEIANLVNSYNNVSRVS